MTGDGNFVNQGEMSGVTVNVNAPKGKGKSAKTLMIPNTVATDKDKINDLNYLVRRYEKFKEWHCKTDGVRMAWGLVRRRYQDDLKVPIKDTPIELFDEGVRYLQGKIDRSKLGRILRVKGKSVYRSFRDYQTLGEDKIDIP